MMGEFIEPYELADRHFAEIEERYLKSIEGRFCKECAHCFVNDFPHVDVPNDLISMACCSWEERAKVGTIVSNIIHRTAQNCAWCDSYKMFVSANDMPSEQDCRRFEAYRRTVIL